MQAPPPTATLTASAVDEPAELPRGALLGRYVVLEKVGAGGMGRVYAAYDPDLDRRVALKVLRGGVGGGATGLAAARLVQEARALARLEHPNVLRVHDVGIAEGQVFVATELLVGRDLAAWAAAEPRSFAALADVFLEIGKGLAAAHAEGLVHRDVKPANMMVGDDGRVLLVDFGIAGEAPAEEGGVLAAAALTGGGGRGRLAALVPAGAGTPGYMAPEQAAGKSAGPAADQYAFALSFYRLLYGEAPRLAPGGGLAAPPARRDVPRRLWPILRRALEAEESRRFPALRDFLAALAEIRSARRRRLFQAAALAVGLAGVAAFASWRVSSESACFGGGDRFASLWNPSRAAALERRVAAAPGAFAALRGAIEAYGASFAEAGELFCRETRQGSASPQLLDLRNDCLDQRLRELDATLELALERPQLEPARIADMVAGLVPVAVCGESRALRAPAAQALDAAGQARLAELRRQQAGLRALWTASAFADGRAASAAAVEAGRALGHLPLLAELLLQRGLFEDALVEAEAGATLEEASLTAAASRHDRVLAEALIRRVRVAGLREERFADAERLAGLARAALAGLGGPALLEADLDDFEGLIARQRGDFARAAERHQAALALRRRELGPDHPLLANSYLRLGNLADDQNRQKEARDYLERALAIQERQFGPSHPALATTLTRLGTLAREDGDLAAARRHHQRALELRLRVFGEGKVPVAESRAYLGELDALAHDFPAARRQFAAALAAFDAELGPGHSRRGILLATMASAFTEAGADREAVAPYTEAAAILARAFGPEHLQVGLIELNLGAVRLRLAEPEAARRHFQRAADILAKAAGPRDPLYLSALGGAGDALERLGRPLPAIELLERCRALDGEIDRGDRARADSAFALARALLSPSLDPERADTSRARQLASEALALYRNNPQASTREIAELEAWMRRRNF